MRERKIAKVTISIPQQLLSLADRLALERATSRSGLIAELLAKEEEAQIRALMEEGYREMAEEDRRLAEETFGLASEMIAHHAEWDQPTDG